MYSSLRFLFLKPCSQWIQIAIHYTFSNSCSFFISLTFFLAWCPLNPACILVAAWPCFSVKFFHNHINTERVSHAITVGKKSLTISTLPHDKCLLTQRIFLLKIENKRKQNIDGYTDFSMHRRLYLIHLIPFPHFFQLFSCSVASETCLDRRCSLNVFFCVVLCDDVT